MVHPDRRGSPVAGLGAKDLVPISPPGSGHLPGVTFPQAAWRVLADAGGQVHLFYPHADPSEAAQAYVASGEAGGVQKAYKCRVRTPWWRVPIARKPTSG